MTRHEELYQFMKKNYEEREIVQCIIGKCKGLYGELDGKDISYTINMAFGKGINDLNYYDPEADTLYIWGRGGGLVYKQGQWAMKEDGTIPVMPDSLSYSIY